MKTALVTASRGIGKAIAGRLAKDGFKIIIHTTGNIAKPEDCAGIVSLLCSDEGRYITGQNIFVDGGKSIQ